MLGMAFFRKHGFVDNLEFLSKGMNTYEGKGFDFSRFS